MNRISEVARRRREKRSSLGDLFPSYSREAERARNQVLDRGILAGGLVAGTGLGLAGLSTLHPRLLGLGGVGRGLFSYGTPSAALGASGIELAEQRGWL